MAGTTVEEARIVYWRTEPPNLPSRQTMHFAAPVWMHSPEWIEQHGTGWRTVGYNVVGVHESGDMVMSVMLVRDVPSGPL